MVVRPPLHRNSATTDETEWLDSMALAIESGNYHELDYPQLAEYLRDMSARDRREVESRLAVLLCHILKWLIQPDKRSRSWQSTIEEQRYELELLLRSGSLRRHAATEFDSVYQVARKRAAIETGLPMESFPKNCPYSLDQVLTSPLDDTSAGSE